MTSAEHLEYESNKELHSLFLKHSLRLCYEKRWVTEWLFNNLASSVIRTDFVIHPDIFSRAILSSVFAKKRIPLINQVFTSKIGNGAYIPVYHWDDVTIGYAFAFRIYTEGGYYGTLLNNNLPFDLPFIARFAYDHREDGNLIFTTTGGNPKQIGIGSEFFGAANMSEGTFVVPTKEYTWDDLPQHPSVVFLGTQQLFKSLRMNNMQKEMFSEELFHFLNNVSPVPSLDDIDEDLDVLNSMESNGDRTPRFTTTKGADLNEWRKEPHQTCRAGDENISNFPSTFSKRNHTPLVVSRDGHVSDRSTFSEASAIADRCSGVFNMHVLDECLHEMGGVVFSKPMPYPKRLDCKWDAGYKPDVYLQLDSVEEFIGNTLRKNCMQVYYDVVLTVNVDYRLLEHPEKKFKRIAPRSEDVICDGSSQLGNYHFIRKETDDCICESMECPFLVAHRAEKARVLEERRRRNRLCAARSNERRRTRLLAENVELRELKKKMENLREREKQLMRENEILRKGLEESTERDPE